jgi:hypothetical protein
MNDTAKALARAFGAANVVALSMTINSNAIAQTTGNATALDPIVVQSPTQKPAAKRSSVAARIVQRGRAAISGRTQRSHSRLPPAAPVRAEPRRPGAMSMDTWRPVAARG